MLTRGEAAVSESLAARRVTASRPRPLPATGPNHLCANDFVFDACATGQHLESLTVTDEFRGAALGVSDRVR